MVLRQPALLVADALGLEPDDELLALRMQPIAEGAEAVRVACRVKFPGAGVRPTAFAGIPAGVAPAQVHWDAVLVKLLHRVEEILLPAFLEGAIALHLHHGRRRAAVDAGDVVGQEPAPPEVLRADRVGALPEERGDERRADFLAGLQEQMGHLLARDGAQAALVVADEGAGPLARPADGEDQAAAGHLEIEVGPAAGAVGRTAAVGREGCWTWGRACGDTAHSFAARTSRLCCRAA